MNKNSIEYFINKKSGYSLVDANIDKTKFLYVGRGNNLDFLTKGKECPFSVYNTEFIRRIFKNAIFNIEGEEHSNRRRYWVKAFSNNCLMSKLTNLAPMMALFFSKQGRYIDPNKTTRILMQKIMLSSILTPRHKPLNLINLYIYKIFLSTLKGGEKYSNFFIVTNFDLLIRKIILAFLKKTIAKDGLLDCIDELNEKKLPNYVFNDILVFCVATTETTSNAIMWMLIELSLREKLQEEINEEISLYIKDEEKVSLLSIKKLPLTISFIYEVLRLHAPNYISVKSTDKTVFIDRKRIDKGELLAYSPLFENFDSDIFKDPQLFRADRFIDENNPNDILSFGYGKHSCLGKNFAVLIMLKILTYLIPNYKVTFLSGNLDDYYYDSGGKHIGKTRLCLTKRL